MAKNYVQDGHVINYTNATGAAISSGDVVPIGHIIGVALVDIADTATGVVQLEGVFELPKTAGATTAINQGTAPVWDLSASAFVKEGTVAAAGDISGSVTCVETAADAATTVKVKLNTAIGTIGA